MSIDYRAHDAAIFSAASQTPTIAAAQVTGDMMILIVGGKPFDAAWSVPGTWTSLGSDASGSTAAGIDLGSVKLQAWYREATSDTETNPLVTEGTPAWNVVGAVVLVFSKAATESWVAPVMVFGADETSGTGISVTFGSDPGVTANDFVVATCAINTDAHGPLTANLTPAQSGVTFGTTTERVEQESTTGGDMTLHATTTPVTSGTGAAAPTATGTGSATAGADRLEAGFIRLRVLATVTADATTVTPSLPDGAFQHRLTADTTTASPTLPDAALAQPVMGTATAASPSLPDGAFRINVGGVAVTAVPTLPDGALAYSLVADATTAAPSLPDGEVSFFSVTITADALIVTPSLEDGAVTYQITGTTTEATPSLPNGAAAFVGAIGRWVDGTTSTRNRSGATLVEDR